MRIEDIKSLDVVPLYNRFRIALENEEYELCTKIQDEFKYRKKIICSVLTLS